MKIATLILTDDRDDPSILFSVDTFYPKVSFETLKTTDRITILYSSGFRVIKDRYQGIDHLLGLQPMEEFIPWLNMQLPNQDIGI